MALTDKLKAIANAIRGKTDKTDLLTLPQMVDEINNEWKIKCYVKQFYIQDDGKHYDDSGNLIGEDTDWKDCFNTDFAGTGQYVMLSYTTDGDIVLTAQSTDAGYSNIQWQLGGIPSGSGISIINHEFSYSLSPTGDSGIIQSCIIRGVNKACRIRLDCGSKNGNKDSIAINVHIDYL